MSENLSRTEKIKMLPEQFADLKSRVQSSEGKISDTKESIINIECAVKHMGEMMATINLSINKICDAIDDQNEQLSKRVSLLEKWRSWTTGLAVTFIAILGFCKDFIIDFVNKQPPPRFP